MKSLSVCLAEWVPYGQMACGESGSRCEDDFGVERRESEAAQEP
jgi:hypothetical protein